MRMAGRAGQVLVLDLLGTRLLALREAAPLIGDGAFGPARPPGQLRRGLLPDVLRVMGRSVCHLPDTQR